MGIGILWKPLSSGGLNPQGTSVLLNYDQGDPYTSVGVYDQSGKLVQNLLKSQANAPEPGADTSGPPVVKYYSKAPGSSFGDNLVVRATTQSGKTMNYNIPRGGLAYNGDLNNPNPGFYAKDSPQGVDGSGAGSQGYPPGFAPGTSGYGAYPGYLGGMFPSPVMSAFNPVTSAPYEFTDPMAFAQKFGDFSRNEAYKNFDVSKDLALKELGTELSGLENFVPAASALKRGQISLDNVFNQKLREAQVDSALPEARGDLSAQGDRARTLASGRLPSSIDDRALELGIRSGAADNASFGGFGAKSSVARKSSDLLSAEERLKISQYGDQLLDSNLAQKKDLLLAPTEYSNAGNQVSVVPTVSGSQLASSNLSFLSQFGSVPATQGLSDTIQQNQFTTGQEQNTRQFNSTGGYNASTFNATAANNFGIAKFGYNVDYAGAVAGAAQTDINTTLALQQQKQYQDIVKEFMNKKQDSDTLGSIIKGGSTLLASLLGGTGKNGTGASLLSQAGSWISNLFGGSSGSSSGIPDLNISSYIPDISSLLGSGGIPGSPVDYAKAGSNLIAALSSGNWELALGEILFGDKLSGIGSKVVSGVGDVVKDVGGGLADGIKSVGDSIGDFFGGLF